MGAASPGLSSDESGNSRYLNTGTGAAAGTTASSFTNGMLGAEAGLDGAGWAGTGAAQTARAAKATVSEAAKNRGMKSSPSVRTANVRARNGAGNGERAAIG